MKKLNSKLFWKELDNFKNMINNGSVSYDPNTTDFSKEFKSYLGNTYEIGDDFDYTYGYQLASNIDLIRFNELYKTNYNAPKAVGNYENPISTEYGTFDSKQHPNLTNLYRNNPTGFKSMYDEAMDKTNQTLNMADFEKYLSDKVSKAPSNTVPMTGGIPLPEDKKRYGGAKRRYMSFGGTPESMIQSNNGNMPTVSQTAGQAAVTGVENMMEQGTNNGIQAANNIPVIGGAIASGAQLTGDIVNTIIEFADTISDPTKLGTIERGLRANRSINNWNENNARVARTADDQVALGSYPTKGVAAAPIYSRYGGARRYMNNGGVMSGGVAQSMSSDGTKFIGNSHEEGGIQLPNMEVENAETMRTPEGGNQQYVYSDAVGVNGKSIADIHKTLANKKGALEKAMLKTGSGTYNGVDKNTREMYAEKINFIEQQENALFQLQEQIKMETGIAQPQYTSRYGGNKVMQFGGTTDFVYPDDSKEIPSMDNVVARRYMKKGGAMTQDEKLALGYGMQLVDNFANSIITAIRPEAPPAQFIQAPQLPTTYNANPQLRDLSSYRSAIKKSIRENTANSSSAMARMMAVDADITKKVGDVYAAKENAENQMKTNATMAATNVNQMNAQYADIANVRRYQRENQIGDEISANVANVASDFASINSELLQRDLDIETIKIMSKLYDETGVFSGNFADTETYKQLIQNDANYSMKIMKNAKKLNRDISKQLETHNKTFGTNLKSDDIK